MARLTDQQKAFVIQGLARFDTPSQVAAAVREEFGIEIDRRRVQDYDPTASKGADVSAKLRAVFDETREAFLADASAVPIAKQAYRLRVLQRLVIKAESQGNAALAAQLLEQAAKEVGGFFTNRRELSGRDGKPIEITARKVTEMSDDELLAIAQGGAQ